MSSILLKSYAKINLTLKILGLRPDGFHEIESIMQSFSLYDEIEIRSKLDRNSIEIHCSDDKVPAGEGNICYKAAELIRKKFNIEKGIRIEIKKNIPMEAGLGGGSSNAAAVLIGLNKIWELKLKEKELMELAAQIGSDVPFFIIGGRCLCRGRGENIEKDVRARGRVPQRYIVVKPDISVPTAWAYEEWDKFRAQSLEHRTQSTGNDLEAVVINKYPVIGEVKKALMEAGCSNAQMTGSGSAVFGSGASEESFRKITFKHKNAFFVEEEDKGVDIAVS